MKASTRGILGASIGGILILVGGIVAFMEAGTSLLSVNSICELIGMVIGGAIVGFGYAFGWQYMKIITAKALGVAAVGSLITIIFSRRDTLLKCFFIFGFALSFGIGIAYLPGIVRGIKLISDERRCRV